MAFVLFLLIRPVLPIWLGYSGWDTLKEWRQNGPAFDAYKEKVRDWLDFLGLWAPLRRMGAAIKAVGERNFNHFITDVFEGEPHSPLKFHTRILSFKVIGQHLYGELNCSLTQIILTLDILKAYQRPKSQQNRLAWSHTEGVRGPLEAKLAGMPGD